MTQDELVERVANLLIEHGCGTGDQCEATARAIIPIVQAEQRERIKAAGMAIVPVEATEEHVMRVFPLLKGKTWAKSFYPADIRHIHAAMIAAAKDQTDG